MKLKHCAALAVIALAAVAGAQASPLSFTGNFTYDNDVQKFTFVVGSESEVVLRTWSYAGGVNAAGQTIASGGFDPVLSLFNASGELIGEQDDAECGAVAADPVTHQCYDVKIATTLGAGSYTVSIQQFPNFSNGSLAEGYFFDGADNRHFAGGFQENGVQRDPHWALDILGAASAVQEGPGGDVPEPASLALLALGAAGIAAISRRRTR